MNSGLHVFNFRWGNAYELEEYKDSQASADALIAQSKADIKEAVAEKKRKF